VVGGSAGVKRRKKCGDFSIAGYDEIAMKNMAGDQTPPAAPKLPEKSVPAATARSSIGKLISQNIWRGTSRYRVAEQGLEGVNRDAKKGDGDLAVLSANGPEPANSIPARAPFGDAAAVNPARPALRNASRETGSTMSRGVSARRGRREKYSPAEEFACRRRLKKNPSVGGAFSIFF
jgi:hypothetical protein